ncbi:uncharacterized protein N7483_013181 [Penicillium malachiteum]|uniref:uncharacterized protein n=1 Tax=Penicillium malachiteum TaxID=1324776 RepID=UPI0025472605|nr:uncharacterized protein N7483_013181 [Penicillium malachiteum]KAJ5716000.1 hypothetical protein N7483_013181 [Penicillium malachiteum]
MLSSTIGVLLLAAGIVSGKTCYNVTVPVSISARNGVFDGINTPTTNTDATAFVLNITRQGSNFTDDALTDYDTVSGRYNISTQYCAPNGTMSNGTTLQILTHGIGLDKSYWDLPYSNFNYSYVDYALSRGFQTLSYDRLGLGNSSHGDPKNEIQTFLEVEALAQITRMIRNGSVPGIRQKPSKIVHVGHSYGSAQTYALVAKYPSLSDGIVLTGFSLNSSFTPLFLAGANFQQASQNRTTSTQSSNKYSPGYLSSGNAGNCEFLFFYPNYFDSKILAYAEQNKQPVTVGELLTMGSLPTTNDFTGPVFVIDGSNDVPFCGGNCTATGGNGTSIAASVKDAFPSAKTFSSYIQPNTGHGLNMHYNATGGYKEIADFLQKQGFAAKMKMKKKTRN